MKKLLVVLLMACGAQGSSLFGLSEYEIIARKLEEPQDKLRRSIQLNRTYKHFIDLSIELPCEVAPRGWRGKYNVETACDILDRQFYEINNFVKKAYKDSQKNQKLDYWKAVAENNNLIKEKDIKDLVESIEGTNDGTLTTKALITRYENHFRKAIKDEIAEHNMREREQNLHNLAKKYPN